MEKIKFVNKDTMTQYVSEDQKILSWGGTDPWVYKFEEEQEETFKDDAAAAEEDEVLEKRAEPIVLERIAPAAAAAATASAPSVSFQKDLANGPNNAVVPSLKAGEMLFLITM